MKRLLAEAPADERELECARRPMHRDIRALRQEVSELRRAIDALKRASADRITAVLPYYGYGRQDRKDKPRVPISAKLVASLLETAGAHRIMALDLHAAQIQGFFDIPVDNIYSGPILLGDVWKQNYKNLVVVSPDVGGVVRARALAKRLESDLAIIDKRRPQANVAEVVNVVGEVEGKDCIIPDDMIDTAGTVSEAARALKGLGARDIYVCATHALLSGPAVERLSKAPIKEVAVTNSIAIPESRRFPALTVLSVGELFAKAIRFTHADQSVSSLFE